MRKPNCPASSAHLPGLVLAVAGALAPGLVVGAVPQAAVMQGFPPAPELRVTPLNAFQPPYLRWSMRHAREVSPTRGIGRAAAPLALLDGQPRALDRLTVKVADQTLSVADYLEQTSTDGLIVLHRGQVVYERYFDGFQPGQPHIWASMTKSVTGLIAAQLIAEGALDPASKLARYVPELSATPFGEASVQANLDMQVAVQYPPQMPPDLGLFAATGLIPRGEGMPGDIYSFLLHTQPAGDPSGPAPFFYQNGSAEALAWALRRITGQNWASLVEQRLWSRFAEHDAYVQVDPLGTEMASGGISCNLRDTARFAELIRRELSRQVPGDSFNQAVHSTFEPGDATVFASGNLGPGRPGYAYRNYWYQKNDGDGSIEASGRFGQKIYINPRREVVIVKLSASADQTRRATRADGEAKTTARMIDSPAAFNGVVSAVLAALPI
ncbi:serine hydrolase [Pseudomonas sp. URMO17WK12:I11]|uniref:serine hydrolase domain-containing protein n=1 Tax=Pseudomonas sp. URMO17WK12:I11 TaxID=1283291 RepID=UPI0011A560CE|nr:serine hydrolase [Pseudomonas sp. URMO17WK12:I11]